MLDPALLEMIDVKQGFAADGLPLLNQPQIHTELSLVGAFCIATLDATKLASTHE